MTTFRVYSRPMAEYIYKHTQIEPVEILPDIIKPGHKVFVYEKTDVILTAIAGYEAEKEDWIKSKEQ